VGRLLLALCAVTILWAGCGSDDEDGVRTALGEYVAALRAGDAQAACSRLSADELAELDRAGSCEEVFSAGFELFEEEGVEIPDYEVSAVEIDGTAATATLTSGSTEESLPLVREGGEWKLDGGTSFGDFHPADPIP
jgi:hypothetical protein